MNRRQAILSAFSSLCVALLATPLKLLGSRRTGLVPESEFYGGGLDKQSTLGTTPFNTAAFEEFGCYVVVNHSHGGATEAERVEDLFHAAFYDLFPGLQVRQLPKKDDRIGIVIAPVDADLSSLFKSQ